MKKFKKLAVIGLAVIMLAGLSVTASAEETELIAGGDMTLVDGVLPGAWTIDAAHTIAPDPLAPNSNNTVLKMASRKVTGGIKVVRKNLSAKLTGESNLYFPQGKYELSFRFASLKTNDDGSLSGVGMRPFPHVYTTDTQTFDILNFNASGTMTVSDGKWHTFVYTLELHEDYTNLNFYITNQYMGDGANHTNCYAYFDDFSLKKVDDAFYYGASDTAFLRDARLNTVTVTESNKTNRISAGARFSETFSELSGAAQTIKAYWESNSNALGGATDIAVMHAIYKEEGGVKTLESVYMPTVTKIALTKGVETDSAYRFHATTDIAVPASDADTKYTVKSFAMTLAGLQAWETDSLTLSTPAA